MSKIKCCKDVRMVKAGGSDNTVGPCCPSRECLPQTPCQFPKVRQALSVSWIMITKDGAFQERSGHLSPPLVMLGKVATVAWQPHNHKGEQSIHLQPSQSHTTILISTFFVCFLISLIYFTVFILIVLFAFCSFSGFLIWRLISFFGNLILKHVRAWIHPLCITDWTSATGI